MKNRKTLAYAALVRDVIRLSDTKWQLSQPRFRDIHRSKFNLVHKLDREIAVSLCSFQYLYSKRTKVCFNVILRHTVVGLIVQLFLEDTALSFDER